MPFKTVTFVMKLLRIPFLLFFIYMNSYAQIDSSFKIDKKVVNLVAVLDSINKIEDIKKDSISNLLFADHWNTTSYNPYKKEVKKYPFNIVFADSTYASPIERKKVITSHYGWRNRRAHKGIDIDLITGDKVMSMFDGKVRYVNRHSGHGKLVVIRHFNGLETVYAHLSKQFVKINDTVKKGQAIGIGGATGNARGSHLHLEVIYKGIYIHPEYLFDFGEQNNIRSQNVWVTKNWGTPYHHNSKRESEILLCNTYEDAIESEKKIIYVVKRGDTLSKISNRHHVSITSICRTNAIRKSSTLRIGQKILLIP